MDSFLMKLKLEPRPEIRTEEGRNEGQGKDRQDASLEQKEVPANIVGITRSFSTTDGAAAHRITR